MDHCTKSLTIVEMEEKHHHTNIYGVVEVIISKHISVDFFFFFILSFPLPPAINLVIVKTLLRNNLVCKHRKLGVTA